MAGRPLALEQPGGAEHQRAGADRGRPFRVASTSRSHSSTPSSSSSGRLPRRRGRGRCPASVDLRERVVGDRGRGRRESVRTCPFVGADEADLPAGDRAQHLVGADRVERGEPSKIRIATSMAGMIASRRVRPVAGMPMFDRFLPCTASSPSASTARRLRPRGPAQVFGAASRGGPSTSSRLCAPGGGPVPNDDAASTCRAARAGGARRAPTPSSSRATPAILEPLPQAALRGAARAAPARRAGLLDLHRRLRARPRRAARRPARDDPLALRGAPRASVSRASRSIRTRSTSTRARS